MIRLLWGKPGNSWYCGFYGVLKKSELWQLYFARKKCAVFSNQLASLFLLLICCLT